jgi:hypothetical protein
VSRARGLTPWGSQGRSGARHVLHRRATSRCWAPHSGGTRHPKNVAGLDVARQRSRPFSFGEGPRAETHRRGALGPSGPHRPTRVGPRGGAPAELHLEPRRAGAGTLDVDLRHVNDPVGQAGPEAN